MNERDNELVDKVAEMMPGVYAVVYEDDARGVEFTDAAFQKFADLIRADEREAKAAWLDGEAGSGRIISCTSAAKAIRARGNT